MGLDPGYRTGVKVAVVDATGKVVATETVYPHVPHCRWDEALAVLSRLVREHDVELIAIGNGTASRETDKLAAELIAKYPELTLTKIVGLKEKDTDAWWGGEIHVPPGLDEAFGISNNKQGIHPKAYVKEYLGRALKPAISTEPNSYFPTAAGLCSPSTRASNCRGRAPGRRMSDFSKAVFGLL